MSHRYNKKKKTDKKSSAPDPKRVTAAMQKMLVSARGNPCLLCNGKPVAAALFIPTPTFLKKAGIKSKFVGGELTLAYSLCASCITLPNQMALVEEAFAKHKDSCDTRYLTDDPQYN